MESRTTRSPGGKLGDVVVWIPETADDMIDIRFVRRQRRLVRLVSRPPTKAKLSALSSSQLYLRTTKKGFEYTFSL